MKKFLITLILFCASISINAQRIETNEIDKFTKVRKVETSIETILSRKVLYTPLYRIDVRISKLNNNYFMSALIKLPYKVKYDETSGLMFLLSNGESVMLYTLYTGIGTQTLIFRGDNNFETAFVLDEISREKLKNNDITDVRVCYLGGHQDYAIKKNKQSIIKNMLVLVDNPDSEELIGLKNKKKNK